MSARAARGTSPTRRNVKFHISSNVERPVLSRHVDENASVSDENDDVVDVVDGDDDDSLMDDLPSVSADTLDKLIASYESLMVVGALLAGFAISLLPSVVERSSSVSAQSTASILPMVSSLWLSGARVCLFLVISCNFFAICALSLANFYLAQLWEKRRAHVVQFRVMTQNYRQLAHHAIVASIPIFATGVAFWAAHHWRPLAPGAIWSSPLEVLALLVLFGTIGLVVATIHAHRSAFVHTLLTPARRRLASRQHLSRAPPSQLPSANAAAPGAAAAAAAAARRTTSSASSGAAAPGAAQSVAIAAAAAAAAAEMDYGASESGVIKRFHTKYF